MSESVRLSLSSLPVEETLQVERLCTRFETAWQCGQRPRAEAYRAEVSAEVWPVLLRELLALEMAFRLHDRDRIAPLDETTSWAAPGGPAVFFPGAVPTSFGDYEKVTEVGHGAQGVVYKAWNCKLKRFEALKMFVGPATERERAHFRFEGEAVAGLEHPSIVTVYGVGEVGGQPFLAMKWIEGQTLAARLRDPKRDLPGLVRLLSEVARAVHFAHQRGILHRDLKPANILLDEQGKPYVADFGLAKRLGDVSVGSVGGIAGTPQYMAPEQARGERDLTTAVDVYGLGAILYEVLTGRAPYQGTVDEILRQVGELAPPQPRSLEPGLDRDLEADCLKCLRRDPVARYASAAELADDLERWLRGEPRRDDGKESWWDQVWRLLVRLWSAVGYRGKAPTLVTWPAFLSSAFSVVLLHGAIFLLAQTDQPVYWVWLLHGVWAAYSLVFLWLYYRRDETLIGMEKYTGTIAFGAVFVLLALFGVVSPWSPLASTRELLPRYYPPLMILVGFYVYVHGVSSWGGYFVLGLAHLPLAFVLRLAPEWAPLLFAGFVGGYYIWMAVYWRRTGDRCRNGDPTL
jgi:serine/threonine-protein kinase